MNNMVRVIMAALAAASLFVNSGCSRQSIAPSDNSSQEIATREIKMHGRSLRIGDNYHGDALWLLNSSEGTFVGPVAVTAEKLARNDQRTTFSIEIEDVNGALFVSPAVESAEMTVCDFHVRKWGNALGVRYDGNLYAVLKSLESTFSMRGKWDHEVVKLGKNFGKVPFGQESKTLAAWLPHQTDGNHQGLPVDDYQTRSANLTIVAQELATHNQFGVVVGPGAHANDFSVICHGRDVMRLSQWPAHTKTAGVIIYRFQAAEPHMRTFIGMPQNSIDVACWPGQISEIKQCRYGIPSKGDCRIDAKVIAGRRK